MYIREITVRSRGMDYNYVRMRNALSKGDYTKAEEYKVLYESGKVHMRSRSVLNYVIAILLCVSVLLGVYILHSEQKVTENTAISETEVVK